MIFFSFIIIIIIIFFFFFFFFFFSCSNSIASAHGRALFEVTIFYTKARQTIPSRREYLLTTIGDMILE
jgi:hypothetical protein